ncbi:MAG: hypothetical protein QF541_22955, partial [Lentisphaeria bacterium]|nr:hypothetical protein [Lentisphaeria bacterium]
DLDEIGQNAQKNAYLVAPVTAGTENRAYNMLGQMLDYNREGYFYIFVGQLSFKRHERLRCRISTA